MHMYHSRILMNSAHFVKSIKLGTITPWYTIFFDTEPIMISLILICMAGNLQNKF